MNTTKTKLIAFDLDDTLLDREKRLPEENAAAMREAAEKGVVLVPASGRFLTAMPAELLAMPFIRYAVSANGAYIYDRGENDRVLAEELLTPALAAEVMTYLDGFDVVYDTYIGCEAFMSADMRTRSADYAKNDFYRARLMDWRKPVDDLKRYVTERGEGVGKVQLYAKNMDDHAFLLRELPKRFPDTSVASSVVNNVEITAKGATKGEALTRLASILGIPAEQTAALGDGLNDVPMLLAAGCGIAMGNASEDVKQAADRVAPDCDENGFAYALRTFLTF